MRNFLLGILLGLVLAASAAAYAAHEQHQDDQLAAIRQYLVEATR